MEKEMGYTEHQQEAEKQAQEHIRLAIHHSGQLVGWLGTAGKPGLRRLAAEALTNLEELQQAFPAPATSSQPVQWVISSEQPVIRWSEIRAQGDKPGGGSGGSGDMR